MWHDEISQEYFYPTYIFSNGSTDIKDDTLYILAVFSDTMQSLITIILNVILKMNNYTLINIYQTLFMLKIEWSVVPKPQLHRQTFHLTQTTTNSLCFERTQNYMGEKFFKF